MIQTLSSNTVPIIIHGFKSHFEHSYLPAPVRNFSPPLDVYTPEEEEDEQGVKFGSSDESWKRVSRHQLKQIEQQINFENSRKVVGRRRCYSA